jgi:hypothetical protein
LRLGSGGGFASNEEGGEGASGADEKERDGEVGKRDSGLRLLNALGVRQRRKRGGAGGPGGRRVEGDNGRQRPGRDAHGRRDVSTQSGSAEPLMSRAWLAAGAGGRRGARGTWADPGRNGVGRARMNSDICNFFK